MSRRAQDWADAQTAGNLTLRAVLDKLAKLADDNGSVWCSQATLAPLLECDVRTIRRSLQALEQRGLIRREARMGPDGSRCTDHIRLIWVKAAPPIEAPAGLVLQ